MRKPKTKLYPYTNKAQKAMVDIIMKKSKGKIYPCTKEAEEIMKKKDYLYDPLPDEVKIFQALVKFVFIMLLIAVIGYVLIILSVLIK